MKKVVRYYFTAWFSFSQVCDFASVVSTSENWAHDGLGGACLRD